MFPGTFSYKNSIYIYISGWLIWGILHMLIIWNLDFSIEVAALDSLINNGWLALECLTIGNTLKYYRPGKGRFGSLVLWVFALAALVTWLTWVCLWYIMPESSRYELFLDASTPVRFCVGLLIVGWFVLLNWVWYYIKTLQEEENRKADMERLAKEAELGNLRQQLQPHFLFNSLNSINALISLKPEQARKMTQQLSDFLRGTMKKDERKPVSLEEEIAHLSLYLDIEKVRFGHRLNTDIVSDEASLGMKIPPLLLQPVVENAIKFGLYDTTEAITIKITTKVEDDNLYVIVENPFDPETSQPRKGTGFGLESIKRRLYLLFGRSDLLQTDVNGNIFITTVKIPQQL